VGQHVVIGWTTFSQYSSFKPASKIASHLDPTDNLNVFDRILVGQESKIN
jgi:hypothetical protein